jgi:chaperonin cofactor prefoldin
MQVKVNVRRHTMDKINRPTTSIMGNGINNAVSIEEFRLYITTLEGLLKDTLNENLKLKQQLNEFIPKKTQYDLKKVQTKVEENIKRYSRGKIFLNELEKKIQLKPINQIMLKDPNKISNPNETSNDQIKNLISQYESQLEAIIAKKSQIENKLNTSEKEKEDLKTKFNDEFVLMSSVIYNLGFLYWSMKSDYEDKLKQNKGWLEMERIKQYNGDY